MSALQQVALLFRNDLFAYEPLEKTISQLFYIENKKYASSVIGNQLKPGNN